MTAEQSWKSTTEWLSIADAAEVLGESAGRIRRLIDDKYLTAVRIDGVVSVPAIVIVDGEPLHSLRGTLFVLHDAGFSDEEALEWLLSPDDTIGSRPIDALLAGRKSEVRRVAQTLA